MTVEFHEKLQKLRKEKGLTQEALAEVLFVSRTAVSKWEAGRGYPNLDSLKALSVFFSVPVDDLISSENIILLAEKEKKSSLAQYLSLVMGMLDVLLLVLLFIPLFGSSAATGVTVPLYALSDIALWEKTAFIVMISLSAVSGACGIILAESNRTRAARCSAAFGIVLSVLGSAVFIAARQPYAALLYFVLLVVKGLLLLRTKS